MTTSDELIRRHVDRINEANARLTRRAQAAADIATAVLLGCIGGPILARWLFGPLW